MLTKPARLFASKYPSKFVSDLNALAPCLIALASCSGVNDYPAASGGAAAIHETNAGTGSAGAATTAQGGSTGVSNGGTAGNVSAGGVSGASAKGGSSSFGAASSAGGSGQGGTANGGTASGGKLTNGGTASGGKLTNGGMTSGGGLANGGMTSGGGLANGGQGSSGGSANAAGSPAFSQVQSILDAKCGICHTLGGNQPDLSSNGDELYATLTSFRVRQCANNPMITPNNSAASALLLVTTGKCGGLRMPQGCSGTSCVTAQEQQTISNWISQGAKH